VIKSGIYGGMFFIQKSELILIFLDLDEQVFKAKK